MVNFRRVLPLALIPALGLASLAACHQGTSDDAQILPGRCDNAPCVSTEGQTVVTSAVSPPPIIGGTLLVTASGKRAVVADPDRDRILSVELASSAVKEITLDQGSEPGRIVENDQGLVYVALRRAGTILLVDPDKGAVIKTEKVCASPRGMAFDPTSEQLHLACASGELMTFAVSSGRGLQVAGSLSLVRSIQVTGGDLRDVVVAGPNLLVSHFRSVQIDTVDASGQLVQSSRPPAPAELEFSPTVAWRMIALPNSGALVLHQQSQTNMLSFADSAPLVNGSGPGQSTGGDIEPSTTATQGYGAGSPGGCPGAVHAAVTQFDGSGSPTNQAGLGNLNNMPVAVDVAVSRLGKVMAVVSAGQHTVFEGDLATVTTRDGCQFQVPASGRIGNQGGAIPDGENSRSVPTSSEPIALAYGADDGLVVQIREPSMLEIHNPHTGAIVRTVALGGDSRADTAHAMFHSNPDLNPMTVSCASCHPEGRDDGHVWNFTDGPRRTASLAGFSLATAPFHWQGDIGDIGTLVDDVYTARMGANPQSDARKAALAAWLPQMPAAPSLSGVDRDSAQRGAAIFADATVGCTTCHSGSLFTNNTTVDVNTGGSFQVPSLIGVGMRAPFMHDGCALTLRDRFSLASCGGGDAHGHTSQLDDGQITDLVSYLETL